MIKIPQIDEDYHPEKIQYNNEIFYYDEKLSIRRALIIDLKLIPFMEIHINDENLTLW